MFFDLPPDPPKLWLPPKPAIIRSVAEYRAVEALNRQRRRAAGELLPTYTYVTSATDTANRTTYTFSDTAIGAAAAGRMVVVGVHGQGAGDTVDAVTITGLPEADVSATLMSPTATARAQLWGAVVNSGTTGDIVVEWNTGQLHMGIGVWALYNLSSTTPIDADGTETSSNASRSVTLDMTANSIAVVVGRRSNTNSISTTNATGRYDATMDSERRAGADYQAMDAETRTVTMASVTSIAGAVWR